MLVRVVLHGQRGSGEMFVDADTAQDAIEAFGTQVRPFDGTLIADRPPLRVVGFDTIESITGPLPVDTTELHLVPALRGGKGAWGTFLMAGLLVVGSLVTGGALSVALLAGGIATALSGVVQLIMPTPKAPKSQSDPEASKYFGNTDNTVGIGTAISLAYGRIPRFGHLLALNVDAQDMVRGSFPASP